MMLEKESLKLLTEAIEEIVVWTPRATSASAASQLAKEIFAEAAKENLHLAIAHLPIDFFANTCSEMERDQEHVTCLRSCLMKPEHLDWLDDIWQVLERVTDKVLHRRMALSSDRR
ncbi:MAG: hypothetical protein HC862_17250 [Scytonema sp. RU_4_4]|nr:hypothetical protein [Scytonema sp. RU_4_4]NJR76617.1 hypothetical protein [Scytonema sp. CRU_2_7]